MNKQFKRHEASAVKQYLSVIIGMLFYCEGLLSTHNPLGPSYSPRTLSEGFACSCCVIVGFVFD